MPRGFRVLSFNWHEPYLCMLAGTGEMFEIVEPYEGMGSIRRWDESRRPRPPNLAVVSMKEAQRGLTSGRYDLAVCHNFNDIKVIYDYPLPAVLVFHNKLTTDLALGGNTVSRESYTASVLPLASRARELVFVSESKREDWGLDGVVIKPGMDIDDTVPYRGHEKRILRVGNLMRERDLMLGFRLQEEICEGFDSTLLGRNPSLGHSRPPESWEDLKSCYSSHRVYLNTTLHPYEDGYNMSMLEAMAAGAPVVSVSNPTSPIENGVNGYVSENVGALRDAIAALMEDADLARTVGRRGKETVAELFSLGSFVAGWRSVMDSVAGVSA